MSPGEPRPPRGSVIDLTRESDFSLGAAAVRPSRSEVVAPGPAIRLQPRVMQVLVALARADGEVVSRDLLIEQCWGNVVVGEDALNRCIGRLRKLSEETGEAFTIETLPRLGYRLVSGAAHAGLTGGKGTDRGHKTRRAWWLGGALLALLMFGGAAAWLVWRRPPPITKPVPIAVGLFASAADDPAVRAFALQVQASVADAVQGTGLEVVNPATATDLAVRTPGAQPGFLLAGQVSADAASLKTQVQLTDSRDRRVLWTDEFARRRAESAILKVQVAAKVADVLRCGFDPLGPARMDPESLALLLKACDLMHDNDRQDEVRDSLQRLASRQPGSARILGLLAIANITAADGLPPEQARKARQDAQGLARRALTIDPAGPDAYIALSSLEDQTPDGWIRSEAWFRQGLKVAPNSPELNNWQSDLLLQMGYVDDALRFARRSTNLDPLGPLKVTSLSDALGAQGRRDEGRQLLAQAAGRWPGNPDLAEAEIRLDIATDDFAGAIKLIATPASRPLGWDTPRSQRLRTALRLATTGLPPTQARALAAEELALLRSGAATPNAAVPLMLVLGRVDDAFAAAQASRPGATLYTGLLFQPLAEAMRRDRRFPALAAKLGLVKFWRAEHRRPDFCNDPALPYSCASFLDGQEG